MSDDIKELIPKFVDFVSDVPIALTSILKEHDITVLESTEELRQIFLEMLFDATKRGLKTKILYDYEYDYYFYFYKDDESIDKELDETFVRYVEKFNKDPHLWEHMPDLMLKSNDKLIAIMNNAIKNNKPISHTSDLFTSAWGGI